MFKAMAIAFAIFAASAAYAEDAVKPPSWQAICGYKWRQYKAEHPGETGRDALNAFRRKPESEGGCGAKQQAVGKNDELIRKYLESIKK